VQQQTIAAPHRYFAQEHVPDKALKMLDYVGARGARNRANENADGFQGGVLKSINDCVRAYRVNAVVRRQLTL
jgi:hypothetical protein